ncbi:MAG: alpha/beta hydrolase [Phototrophicaceae bacterium]
MPQPLIELGGEQSAPIMSIAPANGFVPETYLPMIAPFTDKYRVLSVPPRALWGDGDPPELTPEHSWYSFSVDMLSAYEQFNLTDVVAIGHSIGAVITLLSAIQAPEHFKAIILLDPVIMLPSICDFMREQRQQGKASYSPMVQGAKRRRRRFTDVDEAFENFHGKSIFKDWSDEVLRLYAEHGTVEHEDGLRYLKWSPEWEAFYYSSYYTEIWSDLPKLNEIDVPIFLLSGADSHTLTQPAIEEIQAVVPNASYQSIAGHGHLFPQSAPQQTADTITAWLNAINHRE